MVNYSNGKIYKIECLKDGCTDIYIGSTTKEYLSQRMDTHRSDYNRHKKGIRKNRATSYDIFDKYGIENCTITLLELVNAQNKDELLSRESHYIKTLDCVNKRIPKQTREEYINTNKEKIKQCQKSKYEKYKDIYNERRRAKYAAKKNK